MDATLPDSATHPNLMSSACCRPPLTLQVIYPEALAHVSIELRDNVVIGRNSSECNEALPQRTVSSRHARISASNGYWLEDLGSTNGSRVNGERLLRPAFLAPHAVVRLGDVIGVVREPPHRPFGQSDVLPGTHAAQCRILEQLPRAAADRAPVLIAGETGTGKERLALLVHRASGRRGNYVPVNCAELSPHLMESQLFGHERGAFTGAANAQPGLFDAAQGGTLFLDEIGELPLELQPKLLRVLQENEIRPVGGVRTKPVDVRIVAATNQDLPTMVARGNFRRDLYARLSLWDFRLPPLRHARQDILPWIHLLLHAWMDERKTDVKLEFLPDAAERIVLGDWLDNLRGLNRLVHRLANAARQQPIGMRALKDALPESFESKNASVRHVAVADPARGKHSESTPQRATSSSNPARPSREELLAVFEHKGRNIRATSKHFGKDRRQIYRWLEQFGIQRDADQPEGGRP